MKSNNENEQAKSEIEITDPEELDEIQRVIKTHVGDGPGDIDTDNPPKSDFVSFAGDAVEKEDDK